MIVERELGLKNVILDENTVILDIIEPDGTRKEHYHRYKTRERAEYYYHRWGSEVNCYERKHFCNRCDGQVFNKGVSTKEYSYYCPNCDEDLYSFETYTRCYNT